ncbi:TetR/AcrR family transcriptional regulator [Streptomyces sp. NBC_01428]|uniref:TetR/AcrR family transcriptional regulator n=1 Tax=Streptomyces sp. NBC_01428 TaxID=2903861 RepID=UPI002E314E84|nr:TetR/AcrR family transcriptional regulator [Streptomyces sp. NBC_01428]
MGRETRERPKLTAKGARTRARIVECAARLIHERGVADTTLDEVRAAAEVSGSQLYHYFADKDDLVQAVIDHQADTLAANQRQADLGSAEGLRAWREMVMAHATNTGARGGCPLGSLGGQLSEADPEARALIAAGFDRWSAAMGDSLRNLPAAGHRADGTSPDDLALTLLAALQGGLLLAQVHRDPRVLETVLDTFITLASGNQTAPPDKGAPPAGGA